MPIFDVFLLEAVLNGLLFGGVLALLALGLNLIFGVIDVVWICYAELMMIGMYAVYFLYVDYGVPLLGAFALCILLVALLGTVMHQLVIRPILGGEPINQLLVTGGMLFFLQALATLLFGIDFRNLGLALPSVTIGEIFLPTSRLLAAGTALVAMLGVWLFLKKTYLGIAIRAISQDRAIMPLMGSTPTASTFSPRRSAAGSPGSAPASWCCSTTSTRRSACPSARSPSWSASWAGSAT